MGCVCLSSDQGGAWGRGKGSILGNTGPVNTNVILANLDIVQLEVSDCFRLYFCVGKSSCVQHTTADYTATCIEMVLAFTYDTGHTVGHGSRDLEDQAVVQRQAIRRICSKGHILVEGRWPSPSEGRKKRSGEVALRLRSLSLSLALRKR